jgi:hypothetical protein
MNTEKKWNPGHSVNKGYPYSAIVSKEIMKQRLALDLFKDQEGAKVFFRAEPLLTDFPTWPGYPSQSKEGLIQADQNQLIDAYQFMLDRAYDYHMALETAEGQINVLLDEKPFIPERHGFYTGVRNENFTDQPVHVYLSKYSEGIALYRKPGDSPENLTMWVLSKKDDHGKLQMIDINLPCERIAYATLFALGVQMSEGGNIQYDETDLQPIPAANEPTRENGTFDVLFCRQTAIDRVQEIVVPNIPAKNEEEAFTKANFILQADHNVLDATREEMSIV